MDLTAGMLLQAYSAGLFPMAASRHGEKLHWLDPERRGILPLDRFHLPKRLMRTTLSGRFSVTVDQDFAATIAGCATPMQGRDDTWINARIERLFTELHHLGHAHSIECRLDGELVGGLYGVVLGGAFFGESMFSFVTDASKVALVHLIARLRLGRFRLLDTQFVTEHLRQFGAHEIPRGLYKAQLADALRARPAWLAVPEEASLDAEIRRLGRRHV